MREVSLLFAVVVVVVCVLLLSSWLPQVHKGETNSLVWHREEETTRSRKHRPEPRASLKKSCVCVLLPAFGSKPKQSFKLCQSPAKRMAPRET